MVGHKDGGLARWVSCAYCCWDLGERERRMLVHCAVDEGYCFTYTGSGGRDLKGTKDKPKNLRTAPQSADQTLTGLNLALKVSCDTANPVRVIRGFKGQSKWAPSEGYR